MATPVPAYRTAPSGTRLRQGYRCIINIAADSNIELFEKSATPPGIDIGEKIDTSTFWNEEVRTSAARVLKEILDSQMTCGYDPAVYDSILAVAGVETTITIIFPDGSGLAFFGYLKSFVPSEVNESAMPEATVVFVATNTDPASGDEQPPVYIATVGT